jgi:hypothetical protein
MALSDQFTGLDMKNLIGGPLSASAEASLQLAQSTAGFINTVGFDENKKLRTVDFGYKKKIHNEDGSDSIQELNIETPLIAIVPIPNLQIDTVNIYFDMEVKESSSDESASDMNASLTAGGSIFGFKVSITGSISSHEKNTRSSDNSAKYHVDVTATNHGTPEGLARILDIIAANAAPNMVGSIDVDKSGNPLEGKAKARAEALRQLQGQKDDKSRALTAVKNDYKSALTIFTRTAKAAEDGYISTIQKEIVTTTDEAIQAKLNNCIDTLNTDWGNLIDVHEILSGSPIAPISAIARRRI